MRRDGNRRIITMKVYSLERFHSVERPFSSTVLNTSFFFSEEEIREFFFFLKRVKSGGAEGRWEISERKDEGVVRLENYRRRTAKATSPRATSPRVTSPRVTSPRATLGSRCVHRVLWKCSGYPRWSDRAFPIPGLGSQRNLSLDPPLLGPVSFIIPDYTLLLLTPEITFMKK